jgi:hypothetical protein
MPDKTSVPTKPSGGNEAVIATLRRRRNRARIWFFAFIALIPLGCVGPIALLRFVPERMGTPLMMAAIFLPFVGLGGMLLMLFDRGRYGRALTAAEQAQGMGLHYTEKPAASAYARLQSLRTFSNADGQVGAFNLLAGEAKGLPLLIVDFAFAVGFGKGKSVYDQTVFLLEEAVPGTPDFILYPRDWRDKLSKLLGDRYLDVPGQTAFNQQFALRGDDEAVAAFSPQVVQLCLAEKGITLEAQDGLLAACRFGKRMDPASYPQVVEWMAQVAAALRAGAKGAGERQDGGQK